MKPVFHPSPAKPQNPKTPKPRGLEKFEEIYPGVNSYSIALKRMINYNKLSNLGIMSKIIRDRIDSASMKKYNKTKSKQQMYSFGSTVNQADNAFATRNDMQDIGYKTQ